MFCLICPLLEHINPGFAGARSVPILTRPISGVIKRLQLIGTSVSVIGRTDLCVSCIIIQGLHGFLYSSLYLLHCMISVVPVLVFTFQGVELSRSVVLEFPESHWDISLLFCLLPFPLDSSSYISVPLFKLHLLTLFSYTFCLL